MSNTVFQIYLILVVNLCEKIIFKILFSITPRRGTAGDDDFDSAVKDVTFQPGHIGPKFVEILVIEDFLDEPTEKFTVVLSSNSRAILGGPSVVKILEDDDGNGFIFHILRFVSL